MTEGALSLTDQPGNGKQSLLARKIAIFIAVGTFALDWVTKLLAETYLPPEEIKPLLGTLVSFQLIYNPGAAFSFLSGATWVFTAVAVIVLAAIAWALKHLISIPWAVTLGLTAGGAAGNLFDRLFRQPGFGRGHVVDFINYNGFFVGNMADIAICVAAILIIILAVKNIPLDGGSKHSESESS
ncbi:MAG: signal peptidase II [Actinomycetaceae bacterium]|nr:signal peptidase II [Actinomycetaceae bacterium]